jgi:serine/threonine protein kinase
MTHPASSAESYSIPDHELIRCVGRGSYGEVWLARNVMGTFRAVKIITRKSFEQDRPFEREFQGLQRYEPVSRTHPGLVAVLHIGRNVPGNYFYYVMEVADDLVSGQIVDPVKYVPRTLHEIARQGPVPLADSLPWGLTLAKALGHLHQQGLLHRDIKPSNIIFVNSVPKFADIGLVAAVGEKGTLVGTMGYLPPEGPGNPSADLFSLGKVLYEISLGKNVDQFPELPTGLRDSPEAPAILRLNQVLLKACDPDARRRFQTAEEMHAALADLGPAQNLAYSQQNARASVPERTTTKAVRVALLWAPDHPADLRLAHLLEARLAAEGFDLLLKEPTRINVAWARQVESRIKQAQAIIILLSSRSVQDEMLAYVLEIACQATPAAVRQPLLLPVRIQYSQALPRKLAITLEDPPHYHWENPNDDDRLVTDLVAALNSLSG